MKKLYIFVVLFLGGIFLYGCNEPSKTTHTIKVYVGNDLINNYFVEDGSLFDKDTLDNINVNKSLFLYWSTSKDGEEYTFSLPVESDLSLYAIYDTNTIDLNIDFSKYGNYYRTFSIDDLMSNNLFSKLKTRLYQGASISKYSSSNWKTVKRADIHPDNPGMVWRIYDSGLISVNRNGGKDGEWNKEHVIAKAWLEKIRLESKTGDQHNLRAADVTLNRGRDSKRFKDGSGTYINSSNSFFPGDDHKGDVARIIMYMMVMYSDSGLTINKIIENTNNWEVLLKWHLEDPVDQFEIHRNQVIYEDQGNRNPFIDYPSLTYYVWHDQYGYPQS
ncbi:MAG: endonuclease [Acholeplasma sp.]|nr:endonuclease [Acholeplasma sp.]